MTLWLGRDWNVETVACHSAPDALLATVWKGLVTGAGSLLTGAGSSSGAG